MNYSKGSITIELLIAFMVLTLALSATVIVLFGNQSLAVDSQINNEALYKAQTILEQARADSRTDFDNLKSYTNPLIDQSSGTAFTKNLVVQSLDSFSKQATSTVTWTLNGRTLTITLSTFLTNPTSALGGDTCSQTLSGDWTNPQLMGYADFPSPTGGTNLDVLAHRVYITTNPSTPGADDFYIFGVLDPNQTHIPPLGSLNTGPGLVAVKVVGKYAYVANTSATAQLQVIDVSNPSAPALVSSLDVTPLGDLAVGNSIFYDNKRIYLGLDRPSAVAEFHVIDVSDPLHPIEKASFETNTKVNAIREHNGIAYLAVPDDPSSPTGEQLRVLDVSQADSGTITQLATFTYPNAATMSGIGLELSKDFTHLYLGRGGANSANNPNFFDLNVTIPSSPNINQSKYTNTSNDVTVGAIKVRQNLAFMLTSDTNLGFQIWDLNNLGSASPYGSLNVQQSSTAGMDCEGDLIYIGQSGNRALQIVGPYVAQPFAFTLSNSGDKSVNQGSSVTNTITVSRTTGTPQSVPLSISLSPTATGLNGSLSPTSCTPNSTCTSVLTISTTAATPSGTYAVTVTSGSVTTTFNVTVNPPFVYTLSAAPASLSFTKAAPGTETITVTKTAGTAQAVTLSFSGEPGGVSVTPVTTNSCTPTPGSCQLQFTISINASTHKTGAITVTGAPNAITTSFAIVAN